MIRHELISKTKKITITFAYAYALSKKKKNLFQNMLKRSDKCYGISPLGIMS